MSDRGDVWEASVAIAVRDSQWLYKECHMPTPGSYIPHAGVPEELLGDVAFEAAERFFLFELKGTRPRISSEWTRQKYVKDGRGNRVLKTVPKHSYVSVTSIAHKWLASPEDEESRVNMLRSLLAHHFVYWDQAAVHAKEPASGLVVEPYVLAAINQGPIPALQRPVRLNFKLATADKPVQDRFAGRHTVSSWVPMSALHEGRGCIFEMMRGGKAIKPIRHPLGLTAKHFQKYADILTKSAGPAGAPMHAIVLSTSGEFVRVVTNTNDLTAMFSPAPLPASELEAAQGDVEVIDHQPDRVRRGPRPPRRP